MAPRSEVVYDVFISHASEDALDVALPLAKRLHKAGFRVWCSGFNSTLGLGDRIGEVIALGLKAPRAVIIFSKAYLEKMPRDGIVRGRGWIPLEFLALLDREARGQRVILAVWHDVSGDELARVSPILPIFFAVNMNSGVPTVAKDIAIELVRRQNDTTTMRAVRTRMWSKADSARERATVDPVRELMRNAIDVRAAAGRSRPAKALRDVDRARHRRLSRLRDRATHLRLDCDYELLRGAALTEEHSFAHAQVGSAYDRAWNLARQLADHERQYVALHGLFRFHLIGGMVRQALMYSRRLEGLELRLDRDARRQHTTSLATAAAVGSTLYHAGRFSAARDYLRQGVALYRRQKHGKSAYVYGAVDLGVVCHGYYGWTLWALGMRQRALDEVNVGVRLARSLQHPFSIGFALTFRLQLFVLSKEPTRVVKDADGVTNELREGPAYWRAYASILRGWAVGRAKQPTEGLSQMRDGLRQFTTEGAKIELPFFRALEADVLARHKPKAALSKLSEARDLIRQHGERCHTSEIARIAHLVRSEIRRRKKDA